MRFGTSRTLSNGGVGNQSAVGLRLPDGRISIRSYIWYHKAKMRVEQFLADLDNNLEVDLGETSITPLNARDDYVAVAYAVDRLSRNQNHISLDDGCRDQDVVF